MFDQPPDIAGSDDIGQDLKYYGDNDRNRLDIDEQNLGAQVADGVIVAVLDAHRGVVRVTTTVGDTITATIDDYYVPMPHVGSRVRLSQSAAGGSGCAAT